MKTYFTYVRIWIYLSVEIEISHLCTDSSICLYIHYLNTYIFPNIFICFDKLDILEKMSILNVSHLLTLLWIYLYICIDIYVTKYFFYSLCRYVHLKISCEFLPKKVFDYSNCWLLASNLIENRFALLLIWTTWLLFQELFFPLHIY